MRRTLSRRRVSFVVAAAVASSAPVVLAQSFTVTSSSSTGAGSITEAINQANAWSGSGAFTINFASSLTVTLSGELPIFNNTRGVVINGNGATIDGGYSASGSTGPSNGYRAFFFGVDAGEAAVSPGLQSTASTNWAISNLTIRNTNAEGGNGAGDEIATHGGGGGAGFGGGAFVNAGTLTLSNVSFQDNRATGGAGGQTSRRPQFIAAGGGMGGDAGGGEAGGGGGFGVLATGGWGGEGGAGNFTGGSRGASNSGNDLGGIDGGGGAGSNQTGPTGGGGGVGAVGRNGGFGGGGSASLGGSTGGSGGYGGGGAGRGSGGFGGGDGGRVSTTPNSGAGGGWGAGAAVFVRQGAAVVINDGIMQGGVVRGGAGGIYEAVNNPDAITGPTGQALGSGLFLAGSATWNVSSGNTLTLNDSIGGTTHSLVTGGFTKSGPGTLVLNAFNNYTGGTTVSAGTLTYTGPFTKPTGDITTIANGAIAELSLAEGFGLPNWRSSDLDTHFANSSAFNTDSGGRVGLNPIFSEFTHAGNIGGNIRLAKTGPNLLTLSGVLSTTGGISVESGTLALTGDADNAYLPATVNAGTLLLAKQSTANVHAIGGMLIVNGGTAKLTGTGGDQVWDGTGITLNGGTFDLNGTTETVSTLNGTAGSSLTNTNNSAAGNLAVTGGGTFAGTFATSGNGIGVTVAGGTLTLSGTTDNAYLAATVNAGTLVLAKASTSNVHAVGTGLTINGGTARLGGTGGDQIFDANTVTVNTGGTFDLDGRNEAFATLNGTGIVTSTPAATLRVSDGTFGGAINGAIGLNKTGVGTLVLSGSNTHTGGTTVAGGTLALSRDAFATGSPVLTSGTVTVNAGATLRFDLSNNFGSHDATTGPDVVVNAGIVTNSGGHINALQNLTLNNGSLSAVGESGSFGAFSVRHTLTSTGTSTINLGTNRLTLGQDGDTTFDVASGTLTIASPIADNVDGPGSLHKTGTGTLALRGNNAYSGATTVSAGTLVASSLPSSALRIGSGATLAPGGSIGTLTLGQDLTLAGGAVLQFEFDVGGFPLVAGTDYDTIVSSAALDLRGVDADNPVQLAFVGAGHFSSTAVLTLGTFAGGIQLPTGLTLDQVFRLAGDTHGVTGVELVGNSLVAVVPEPVTISWLAVGGLGLLRRRRR